jgi:hypothetical protein
MPNVQVQNYLLNASNEKFNGIWKLTRAMKAAGWRYKASSDAVAKDTTGNPANDKWGGGGTIFTVTVSGAIDAPTTTAYGGRSTVSGVTGATFTSGSVGHYLRIAGATNGANNGDWLITSFVSSTSVVIENPAAVAETTAGSAVWTEVSPLTDTYPAAITGASGIGAWWTAQGPSTMRISIGTSNPAGFIRGENVVQSGTGATGEFMGVMPDAAGGLGYIVVAPRLSGSGAAPRGWSTSGVITGDRSGSTVTPTAVVEYVREVVFWKNTTTNGHIYFQCIDQASEGTTTSTTGRFSTMASLGTATATVCPGGATGGSPTTNGFPTVGTFVCVGTGGSGAAATGSADMSASSGAVGTGLLQILVANAIEDASVSPDGTISFLCGTPVTAFSFLGWGFHRLDDTEDGEVDPYVWFIPTAAGIYLRSRTVFTGLISNTDVFTASTFVTAGANSTYVGWRRRGFPTGTFDAFQEFQGALLGYGVNSNAPVITTTPTTVDRVACAFVNVSVREPVWIYSGQVSQKQRKGTLRWWYIVQGASGTDTYDGKRWVQLSTSVNAAIVAGPADQTTSPLNG